MEDARIKERRHRHGRRVHTHPYVVPHRHLTAPRLSRPACQTPHEQIRYEQAAKEHNHSHGLVDPSIKRSREAIRVVLLSLLVLAVAALAQLFVFAASGSIALLADLIHNFGDALTAVPLGIAFALRSTIAERRAGLFVVGAIFVSACVAGTEAVLRLVHPSAPTHLPALALAGVIGFAGNALAARIRMRAGRRLDSAALVADGEHARADAYVSLAVIASALVIAAGIPVADPIIGLVICGVILRITWQSWQTIHGHQHAH